MIWRFRFTSRCFFHEHLEIPPYLVGFGVRRFQLFNEESIVRRFFVGFNFTGLSATCRGAWLRSYVVLELVMVRFFVFCFRFVGIRPRAVFFFSLHVDHALAWAAHGRAWCGPLRSNAVGGFASCVLTHQVR